MIAAVYRLLLWTGWPLLLIYVVSSGIRHQSLRYIAQRFGLCLPVSSKRPLWIHCVSVGELNTALLLIEQWIDKYPEDDILITTSTVSAARVFKSKAKPQIQHCYLPLDYMFLAKRFLKRLNPRAAIIMETEVWLNLFQACAEFHVPAVIINARLSKHIVNANVWIRNYYEQSLNLLKAIYTKSERDKETYLQVGAPSWKIKTIGNLKYAAKFDKQLPDLINKPYILAASTHEDEELQIAKVWQQTEKEDIILVIAPRHPQRSKKILNTLAHNHIRANYYSPDIAAANDIILYDRIGQLPQLIKHARLVFLGGSLVDKGGHNILEAAQLGTPQVTGLYLDNIAEEAQALNEIGGLIIVDNAHALADIFGHVVKQPDYYQKNAEAAQNYLAQYADIAQSYIAELESLDFQPQLSW